MAKDQEKTDESRKWPWDWHKSKELTDMVLKRIVKNLPSYAYDAAYSKPEEVGIGDSLYVGFQVYCLVVKDCFQKAATEESKSLKPQLSEIAEEAYQVIDLLLKWVEVRANVDYHTRYVPINHPCSHAELANRWDTVVRNFELCISSAKELSEPEQNTIWTKIKACLLKLYEVTLKVIVDAVMERFWPK